jgi:large subunit ribosomal protein L9
MEVILRQDVPNLGKRGDVVRVKNGYARNYLIPRQFAMKVTSGARRQVEIERAAHNRKLDLMRGQHEELVGRIESLSFTVAGKASDVGRLYGSVGENEVVKLLAAKGIEIGRHQVVLEDHIKQVGVYHIPIRFQQDLLAQAKVWVVAEGDEQGAGLPEDVPEPLLYIGGHQSLDEARAHAEEILAEEEPAETEEPSEDSLEVEDEETAKVDEETGEVDEVTDEEDEATGEVDEDEPSS